MAGLLDGIMEATRQSSNLNRKAALWDCCLSRIRSLFRYCGGDDCVSLVIRPSDTSLRLTPVTTILEIADSVPNPSERLCPADRRRRNPLSFV